VKRFDTDQLIFVIALAVAALGVAIWKIFHAF
jgi:hypothetical protein